MLSIEERGLQPYSDFSNTLYNRMGKTGGHESHEIINQWSEQ
jgi:hypothetical protein